MDKQAELKKIKQGVYVVIIFVTRYLKWIISAVTFVIIILGGLFFVWPEYKNIVNKSDKISGDNDREYLERKKYFNKLSELKLKYGKINSEDVKKIRAISPYEKNHEKLLMQIEKIVSDSGFILTSVNFSAENDDQKNQAPALNNESGAPVIPIGEKTAKKIKVSMEIMGTDYSGFKNVLNAFENNLRLTDITTITIDLEGRKTSLSGYVYYMD